MTGRCRMLLMFSVSSLVVLTQLEQELTNHHPEVTTGTSWDADTFILAVECPDTALAIWRVRTVVLTFDPESTIRQQVLSPGEIYDRHLSSSVEPSVG